jgi:REP element-mobilizing transposase RayT
MSGDAHATNTPVQKRLGGNLPHWIRKGAAYAVTFRLYDSLPQEKLGAYQEEKEHWQKLLQQAKDEQDAALLDRCATALDELFHKHIDQYLEQGYGSCWLHQEPIQTLVRETLLHFNGERYEIHAYAIMPNHVHVLVSPKEGHSPSDILHTWKSFSAHKANSLLNRQGEFWQKESYDHLIRDQKDFDNQCQYILNQKTQAKASLAPWQRRPADDPQSHERVSAATPRDAHATFSSRGTGVPPVVPTPMSGDAHATHEVIPLETIAGYIDWTPFFHTWEIRGVWQREKLALKTSNPEGAAQAAILHAEAQELLEEIIRDKRFVARGAYGLFPAAAVGDDIEVYADETRTQVLATYHTLREQIQKTSGNPNCALADWIAPKGAGKRDYVGSFVVGIHGADEWAREVETSEHDPYKSIMIKALADRLAEAFAELLHHRVRCLWGFETEAELTQDQLIHENYRGIRPAPGYPAQPDHTEKKILFQVLQANGKTGVALTESFAMYPGAAVCGLYFSHPDSHYFSINDLQRDQVEDYARRKDMAYETCAKWLGPWLGY